MHACGARRRVRAQAWVCGGAPRKRRQASASRQATCCGHTAPAHTLRRAARCRPAPAPCPALATSSTSMGAKNCAAPAECGEPKRMAVSATRSMSDTAHRRRTAWRCSAGRLLVVCVEAAACAGPGGGGSCARMRVACPCTQPADTLLHATHSPKPPPKLLCVTNGLGLQSEDQHTCAVAAV
jgi:hypothetical protein